jgi:hypothetical protein
MPRPDFPPIKTPVTPVKLTLIQYSLIFTWLPPPSPYFQIWLHS